jgi:hypothetical protein
MASWFEQTTGASKPLTSEPPAILRQILGLFLHVPIAMGVGTCVGISLDMFVYEPIVKALGLHPSQLPDFGCFNPFFWAGSILIGALINYRTRHRSAYWVAVFGVVYLLWTIVYYHTPLFTEPSIFVRPDNSGHSLRYGLYVLFSPACKGGECLEQFFVTVPVLNSIAYSIGAWLGLRFAEEGSRQDLHGSSSRAED